MTGPRRSASGGRIGPIDVVPPLLAVVAEGAWIAALYGFIQAAAGQASVLGVVGLAVAAGTGLAIGRVFAVRFGSQWAVTVVGLTALAAAGGWLAAAEARELLAGGSVGDALGRHPGGWLAGLALLRGTAHIRRDSSERVLATAIAIGLPGLALLVIVGGAIGEPWRSRFSDDAVVAVLVFIVAATVGLALARISALGGPAGFDWRRNRAWLGLLVVVVLAVAAAATPLSLAIGPAIQVAIAALVVPLIVVGAFAGLGQTPRRLFVLLFGLSAFLLIAIQFAPSGALEVVLPEEGGGGGAGENEPAMAFALGGLFLVAAVIAILVLVRLWMRETTRPAESDVPEERTIDLGAGRLPRLRLPARPGRSRRAERPSDGASAYVALLHDLAREPAVAREPAETPSEHARRLHADLLGDFGLDLLAADYQLVRFGGLALSASENRRAMDRWRRLRQSLVRAAAGRGPLSRFRL